MELLQQLKVYKNIPILLQDHYFYMQKKLTLLLSQDLRNSYLNILVSQQLGQLDIFLKSV